MKSGDLISRGRGAGHPNRPKAGVGLGVGNHAGTDGETNALVGRLVVGEVFGEDTDHAGVVVGLGRAMSSLSVEEWLMRRWMVRYTDRRVIGRAECSQRRAQLC